MNIILLPFVFGAILSCAFGSEIEKSVGYRLPTNVVPISYEILLEPDFVTDTFNGSAFIDIRVTSPTNFIRLHAFQLNISLGDIDVITGGGGVIIPTSIEFSGDDRHSLTINFPQIVNIGIYILRIKHFVGILNRDDDGFYLARYTAEDGEIRKLATTQFQPTGARRAFPCFDEPALKAFFRIGFIRPHDYISIANTDLESSLQISTYRVLDWHRITHNVMSTYLVAFVVCDFKYVADGNHRVYARPQLINEGRGDYALSKSRPLLDGIEDFVGIPYSWPKMDQIGIPDGYFWAGAMENWGLVTYRESLILYASGITDSPNKEFIVSIMGHEYGHKWFGNLVSPAWWDYLWLNEGFASYFDYYGPNIQSVEPDMEMMTQFIIKATQVALRQDSSINTTPMRREVNSPSEILSMFNFVIYPKAAAVIKMMEDVMLTPVFRMGLNRYLRKLEYSVAEPQNLYDSLQQSVDESGLSYLPPNGTIASVMTTWELNAGYPLVTVTRNYISGNVLLHQRRFIDSNPNNDNPSLWDIPISYSTSSRLNFHYTHPELWLLNREETRYFPSLSSGNWLILNNRQTGYYRVNYDITNWYLIINYINSESYINIDRINRAQLIDDAFALARFGVLDYPVALDLSLYLSREIDFIPLSPYFTAISFLNQFMQNSYIFPVYSLYLQEILNTVYNVVGLIENENDNHLVKLTRQQVLHWMCRHGDLSCRSHSLNSIRAWRNNGIPVPPNMQTVYACSALRIGDEADFDFIYTMYRTSELVIRNRMLAALGCVENFGLLNNYLDIILAENSTILEGDRLTALAGIHGAGVIGLNHFYNYFVTNYEVFRSRFSDAQFRTIVNSLASRFTTRSQLESFRQFVSYSDSFDLFTAALNTIESNVEWSERNVPVISSWLTSRRYNSV